MRVQARSGSALRLAATGLGFAALVAALPARADGGGGGEDDLCRLMLGPHVLHFAAYQPDSGGVEGYCRKIPAAGRTILVFDLLSDRLRSVPVEVTIVPGTAETAPGTAGVARLAPAVHPTGSLSLQHDFEPGRYVAIVSVPGEEELVGRFAFSIGGSPVWKYAGLALAAAIFGAGMYFWPSRKRPPAPSSRERGGSAL